MPAKLLPRFRSSFVLALASGLLLASCSGAPEATSEDLLEELSSPLAVSRPRTLLVHIYYQTEENLSRFSEELDLLEHADRKAGFVDALVDEKTYATLVEQGFKVEIDEEQTALFDRMSSMSTMSIPGYTCYRTVEETSAR